MRAVLRDPFSNRLVSIRQAQLEQRCSYCGEQLLNNYIFAVEGDLKGWRCLTHLDTVLMTMTFKELETP